jgi:hypothetical protein
MPRGDNWKNLVCQVTDCDTKTWSDARYCSLHYEHMRKWGKFDRTIYDKIAEKYIIDDNGCWLWQKTMGMDGYSRITIAGKIQSLHRVMYIHAKGKIPAGLVIDHLCRVRHCINPDHLEAVTSGENVMRGIGPTARNKQKTHCIRGHELIAKNLAVSELKKGHRICKICIMIRYRKYQERNKNAKLCQAI